MRTSDGAPDIDAQPPCFYRFSPNIFAEEAPYFFERDPETNVLRLRFQDDGYPWMAGSGKWLYCIDCHERYISTNEKVNKTHVPFRDKVRLACPFLRRPLCVIMPCCVSFFFGRRRSTS